MHRAFTLVEIIIAIVIIGVMVGVAIPRIASQKETGFFMEAMVHARAYQTAQKVYCLDHPITITPPTCTWDPSPICANLEIGSTLTNFNVACNTGTGVVTLTRNVDGPVYSIIVPTTGSPTCAACPGYLRKLLQ